MQSEGAQSKAKGRSGSRREEKGDDGKGGDDCGKKGKKGGGKTMKGSEEENGGEKGNGGKVSKRSDGKGKTRAEKVSRRILKILRYYCAGLKDATDQSVTIVQPQMSNIHRENTELR